MINVQQLKKLFPNTPTATLALYVEPLNATLTKYEITSTNAIAAFIAQVGHESNGFQSVVENLNYSAAGLLKTFGKYFNADQAATYQRNPEKIANRVYANRMGNGSEASGDGWKYRGAGLIQLTGATNQHAYGKDLHSPLGATDSAGWYFQTNGLIPLAEAGDIVTLTKRINGGTNGLAERQALYKNALNVIS